VWEDSFPLRGGWHLSLVSFKGCTYSQCEWRSDSLVCTNTDTTEIKEAEEKLVSTGARSKSRRTYKGFA
jgi:hypothetical protein